MEFAAPPEGPEGVAEPAAEPAAIGPTATEKLATARQHKEDGNSHFKDGKFSKAKRSYGMVFAYIDGLHGPNSQMKQYVRGCKITADDEAEITALRLVVWTNLAMTYLKLEKPRRALDFCGKALANDPRNMKAHYRSGLAWMALGDLDKARAFFGTAEECDPGNKSVKRSLALLQKKYKVVEQRERKRYAGMFE